MKLTEKHCVVCVPGIIPLTAEGSAALLKELPHWEVRGDGRSIQRLFGFESYWAGLGFVNAVAWIAQQEKHHPDMELGYKKVTVRFTTHAAGGLTENDFICAAKVDRLLG